MRPRPTRRLLHSCSGSNFCIRGVAKCDSVIIIPELFPKSSPKNDFIKKGGEPDCERTAKIVLDEFRGGKIGKITLEMPEDIHEMEAKMVREEKEKKAFRYWHWRNACWYLMC